MSKEICLRKFTDRPTYCIQQQGVYFGDKLINIGSTNSLIKAIFIFIKSLKGVTHD